MAIINFKCKRRDKVFDCDVGKIDFELVDGRPQFEREIGCSHCGRLSLDEVEFTEKCHPEFISGLVNLGLLNYGG